MPEPEARPATPLDEAVRWAVRFESGRATDADRQRFEQWRAQSPAHTRAWAEVQGLDQELGAMAGNRRRLVLDSLNLASERQAGQRRRTGIKLLGLGTLAASAGGAGFKLAQLGHGERLATGIGQRRALPLPDGTQLQLATATRAEIAFGPLRRIIHLQAGEIFADTGTDPHSPLRPRGFWVHARHLRLQALGTRFGVRVEAGSTRLYVASGRVAVHDPGLPAPRVASAGESLRIPDDPAQPLQTLPDEGLAPDSWTQGVLVVRRMPLPRFLAELSRYHDGPAIEAAASLRSLAVSGVFHLDGPDPVGRALTALQGSLALRIERSASGRIRVLGAG